MNQIIVLAGNHDEFIRYLRELLSNKYVYGSAPKKLHGIEAEEIIVVGTFWDRKDAGDLWDAALSRVRR
jgi:hypothetical protein